MRKSGWSGERITFATANAGINWYQQALMMANYCSGISVYGLEKAKVESFAKSVMKDMGFTNSEISYALKNMKI